MLRNLTIASSFTVDSSRNLPRIFYRKHGDVTNLCCDRTLLRSMKFGKLLKSWAAEEEPENSELVLRFKDLKKQLKLVKPAEQGHFRAHVVAFCRRDRPALLC